MPTRRGPRLRLFHHERVGLVRPTPIAAPLLSGWRVIAPPSLPAPPVLNHRDRWVLGELFLQVSVECRRRLRHNDHDLLSHVAFLGLSRTRTLDPLIRSCPAPRTQDTQATQA